MSKLQLLCFLSEPEAQGWSRLGAALAQAGLSVHDLGASDAPSPAHAGLAWGAVEPLLAWLEARGGWHHSPLSWLGPAPQPAQMERLLALGLTGWWPQPNATEPLPAWLLAALALDATRWQAQQQQQQQLAHLRTQMDERKWVDRAKGLLMTARGMGEDEAFRLLRSSAMHANLRMGEVSRSVVEAAQWAEAINRAGQLRMLSQRLVKLAAQRLAGVDARRARTLQHQATQRAQENLAHLASLAALPLLSTAPATLPQCLADTQHAWDALRTALEARQQTPALLLGCDALAATLLHHADALTDALEAHGQRRALHIVNLCGRQRMRAQRLAKTALLQDLAGTTSPVPAPISAHTAPDLVQQLDEFETALLELERAPLSSPDTRALLAQARDEWLRLLRGLRAGSSDEGRAALAGSADALLELFEQLTAAYEHSLQVIMA